MKEILYNPALLDTINFCKQNNIDCSGTFLIKNTRGYTYKLIRESDNEMVATVTLHKRSVSTHTINNN